MSEPHTVTFSPQPYEVQIVDADGQAIKVGSVLQQVKAYGREHPVRGLVIDVCLPENVQQSSSPRSMLTCVGDILIQHSDCAGVCTGSNKYGNWRHVPREQQTYRERFLSWLRTPWECHEYHAEDGPEPCKRPECIARDGIMSLLPCDPVDWEAGPWPDSIEDCLSFMAAHLDEKQKQMDTP